VGAGGDVDGDDPSMPDGRSPARPGRRPPHSARRGPAKVGQLQRPKSPPAASWARFWCQGRLAP
jgi:hypothetical protein